MPRPKASTFSSDSNEDRQNAQLSTLRRRNKQTESSIYLYVSLAQLCEMASYIITDFGILPGAIKDWQTFKFTKEIKQQLEH